ncbi:TetR/AcrR family transcriptional regulator [Rhodococcus artemisiae]|uniref:TetR/AcrR family transcriptional regulator n=1 Tax=Rhodococcus artemisiae TaxID=714159 RepID=A0ABU7LLC9_9NOCA|nr:TetR/AcrR family transcriptional regulator [Rhodococcus artemisiae]MEE2062321.1 TetR/AcrR family transcriptional regulator [Rhodococcus artemisiae]
MNAPLVDPSSGVGTSKAAARIRAAATEVFAAKGYGAASTREIAARLDLSPGAVYPHYRTKESLLFAIALEGHLAVLDTITQAADTTTHPRDQLAATVSAYVKWHARHHEIARVVQYELRALSEEHFQAIAKIRRATSKTFERIIESGNAAGEFDTIDSRAATLAITSLGIDVSRWFPSKAYSDPETLAERYVELAVRMVG